MAPCLPLPTPMVVFCLFGYLSIIGLLLGHKYNRRHPSVNSLMLFSPISIIFYLLLSS